MSHELTTAISFRRGKKVLGAEWAGVRRMQRRCSLGLEERLPAWLSLISAGGLFQTPGAHPGLDLGNTTIPTKQTTITTHPQPRKAVSQGNDASNDFGTLPESVYRYYHLLGGFKKATCNLCIQNGPGSLL